MTFCKEKVFTVFHEGHILLVFFYPINLVVAYPLNKLSLSCCQLLKIEAGKGLRFYLIFSLFLTLIA